MIGITLGDVTGIGPEITVKAISEELKNDNEQYLIIGEPEIVSDTCQRLNISLTFETELNKDARVFVKNPSSIKLSKPLSKGEARAALAAVEWLKYGAMECLNKRLDALITAPVNKESIIR
ncbi:MAG TPA: 4-hydroxythreonine-4-phosphate dehydrogenase PdxA, partial [Verrucomicrobiota bacterium]|nr:4-hydroxythreonine-4-phosphate dehydrogenase PdxA [Verrucomicrobiota bacterium]